MEETPQASAVTTPVKEANILASKSYATPDTLTSISSTPDNGSQNMGINKSPVGAKPSSRVRVVVRFRPMSETEKTEGQVVQYLDDTSISFQNSKEFNFDRVFTPDASQADVFHSTMKDTVQDLFNGYNSTILAYGQAGSGKSYTMNGEPENTESKGLIPRIGGAILNRISENSDSNIEYTLSVSYMETHQDQVYDLLSRVPGSVAIQDLPFNNIRVKNLTKLYVNSADDFHATITKGLQNKTQTKINSSRSNSIFQINLSQYNCSEDSMRKSHLLLVDLADSDENGADGVSENPLNKVVNALTNNKSSYIPYKDSALTRILQESLGGNSRTTFILNCSPSSLNESETLSTLRFGSKSQMIKTTAHVNMFPGSSNLINRLKQISEIKDSQVIRISQLETELAKSEQENKHDQESELMIRQLNERVLRLTELLSQAPSLDVHNKNIPLSIQLKDSQFINEELLKDLESKCHELVRLELKVDELEEKVSKFTSAEVEAKKTLVLEKTLEQFSEKLQELETQNDVLRKNIKNTKQVSELRNERIKTLETMVKDQKAHANIESLNFEDKLSYLKDRLTVVKKHSGGSSNGTYANGASTRVFSTPMPMTQTPTTGDHHSMFNERDVDGGVLTRRTTNSSTSTQSFMGRVGLNLHIVKPIRGAVKEEEDNKENRNSLAA